jgi:hypothetical protein
MTPTRYPGWRILGFILGFNNLLWFAGALSLVLRGTDTPLMMAGWVAKGMTASSPEFLTFTFSMALTMGGAAMTITRPARGFLIQGDGYLASSMSIAVFIKGSPTWGPAVAFLAAPGVLFTWLGVKQLGVDRG